jgi:hypothetical protein
VISRPEYPALLFVDLSLRRYRCPVYVKSCGKVVKQYQSRVLVLRLVRSANQARL